MMPVLRITGESASGQLVLALCQPEYHTNRNIHNSCHCFTRNPMPPGQVFREIESLTF